MDIRALECVHADSSALGEVNKSEKVSYGFGSADADPHLSRRALSTRLQPGAKASCERELKLPSSD